MRPMFVQTGNKDSAITGRGANPIVSRYRRTSGRSFFAFLGANRQRKLILSFIIILLIFSPSAIRAGDTEVFLNAFTEAATAYLNDCFLLLGTTADGLVSEILPKATALEIAQNVQKRVRVIRAKLKAVSQRRITDLDRQLIRLLDNGYACLDHQAWALVKFTEQRTKETANAFEDQRTRCQDRIKTLASFYSALPPAPELPEPLSTR